MKRFQQLPYDWLLVGIIAAIFYSILLWQGSFLPDNDAYFHISLAERILTDGYVSRIPQLAHTIHAERYVDFHFLYHYVLIPFIIICGWNLILAAKLSTVFFCATGTASFYYIIKKLNCQLALLWVLLYLTGSVVFSGRLLFGRGVTLYLILLYWQIYALHIKKWRLACLLAFISVWTYPGFMIGLGFSVVYSLSLLLNDYKQALANWQQLIAVPLGCLGGFIIHPAFPAQFYGFFLEFIIHSIGAPGLESISEWEAPRSRVLIEAYLIILPLSLFTLLIKNQSSPLSRSLLALATLLLLSSFRSQKTFEYAIPMLLFWLALESPQTLKGTRKYIVIACASLVIVLWNIPRLYNGMQLQFQANHPAPALQAASFLKSNTNPGSLVLMNWDEFPVFYYKNQSNRYSYGLNPVYAYGKNKAIYYQLQKVNAGSSANAASLVQQLGIQYFVINTRKQPAGQMALLRSGRLKLIFRNHKYQIYQIMSDSTSPIVQ